ncbi:MAG: ABC transporter ATP-binding protein [Acetatifactor muris]|nr:ABC transporter ATP-binding protein [Acetatifactor muris]MCM1525697.1 ABC transporter ATP-binding protein [Bacteroides sp.]
MAITAKDLGKKYQVGSGDLWPVRHMDMSIEKGVFVGITGRSGSGKSTLLKMLGGLLQPTEGNVEVDGRDIYALSERDMARYRCDKVGFIFQDYFLEEMYTVYQNVEIVLMISKVPVRERRELIDQVLETVGMLHKKDTMVRNLSGGEKQRVCIARAIVNEPDILCADEPCGNLDRDNGQGIMRLLRAQVEQGKTVLLVTHNPEDAILTDEVITLQDGKIINHEFPGHS